MDHEPADGFRLDGYKCLGAAFDLRQSSSHPTALIAALHFQPLAPRPRCSFIPVDVSSETPKNGHQCLGSSLTTADTRSTVPDTQQLLPSSDTVDIASLLAQLQSPATGSSRQVMRACPGSD
ncbi:hypothetical protein CORC01_14395 [Colletotrichum orchidophilum]|uniref:Uncharacterized protein n=1 Tax=Colletotrichum orchidophilum TaxID=1209926 RepID=A0A1G4AMA5_9PEZI|nr:uncharacterized protein CORC01_14395 [Colletotrichum orchidophilum]OHE90308.1 hypothetical protein CORC01_14395 [Colletotrichum orchidophilum]